MSASSLSPVGKRKMFPYHPSLLCPCFCLFFFPHLILKRELAGLILSMHQFLTMCEEVPGTLIKDSFAREFQRKLEHCKSVTVPELNM
jgi:hypothetical protein